MRKNLARFFKMEDERRAVELARTFEAVRKTHQELMDALAGATLYADFEALSTPYRAATRLWTMTHGLPPWRKLVNGTGANFFAYNEPSTC